MNRGGPLGCGLGRIRIKTSHHESKPALSPLNDTCKAQNAQQFIGILGFIKGRKYIFQLSGIRLPRRCLSYCLISSN